MGRTSMFFLKQSCDQYCYSFSMQLKLLALLPSVASHSAMIPLVHQVLLPMLHKDVNPYVMSYAIVHVYVLSSLCRE